MPRSPSPAVARLGLVKPWRMFHFIEKSLSTGNTREFERPLFPADTKALLVHFIECARALNDTAFVRKRDQTKISIHMADWKSLKTAMFSVAKQRLPDTLRDHRSKIESFTAFAEEKMTVGDAAEVYLQKVLASVSLKPRSKDYREMMIDFIRRSWPSLFETDVRKISLRDCEVWLSRYQQRYSASVVNNSIGTLRAIFETRQKPMVRTPPRLYLAGSSNSLCLLIPCGDSMI